MHPSENGSESPRVISQAEADRCCAASEQSDSSAPSSPTVPGMVALPVVHVAPIQPATVVLAALPDPVPLSAAKARRYLRLSVFLI